MCSSLLLFLLLQWILEVFALNQSEYGKTWMYIPDGNDEPQIAILTEPSEEDLGVRMRSGNFEKDILFLLYTRKNPDEYSELSLDSAEASQEQGNSSERPFDNEYFDTSKDVKLITHGWKSSGRSDTVINIKDAYIRTRDYNVIIVDWEKLAADIFYIFSVRNTKKVGQKTARLIDYLIEQYGMSPNQFHLVGHSLGAHASGFTGSFVKNGKINRVTGLDPTAPGFEIIPIIHDHLDKSDAQFVDVIHTCAPALGYSKPLGHSDFYPNKGTPPQPGCEGISHIFEACSHARSHKYFVESIYKGGFTARKCANYDTIDKSTCNGSENNMGEYTNRENQGIFYLETNAKEPYSKSYDLE